MAKKKTTKKIVDAPERPSVPPVPVEPEAPAPPVETAPEPLPASLEPLEPGEVIHDDKEQSIVIDGTVHHHIREATDGRWIYAPVRADG
jgi:hypothetical protein